MNIDIRGQPYCVHYIQVPKLGLTTLTDSGVESQTRMHLHAGTMLLYCLSQMHTFTKHRKNRSIRRRIVRENVKFCTVKKLLIFFCVQFILRLKFIDWRCFWAQNISDMILAQSQRSLALRLGLWIMNLVSPYLHSRSPLRFRYSYTLRSSSFDSPVDEFRAP